MGKDVVPIKLLLELQKYEEIVKELKGLPWPRNQEHYIPLKLDSPPTNVRPYRYPYVQKNKIEKIVKEMLEVESIQLSISSFFSSILLVKKKDGS